MTGWVRPRLPWAGERAGGDLVRRPGLVVEAGFGIVCAVVLAVTAVAIGVRWGGVYWVFDAAAGAVVCWIALRWRHWGRSAVVGQSVAVAATLLAWAAGLPQEPGPAMVLGLAVLVGSAVRTFPPRRAGVVAAAGLAVVAGTWLTDWLTSPGISAVTTFNVAGWLGALAVGLCGRLLDGRRRAVVARVRREERMELARELHDVAAHHLTGIVIQAQAGQLAAGQLAAGQLAAGQHADTVGRSLADIELAGCDALGAIRTVVGLLREGGDDDAIRSAPGSEQLRDLVRRFADHGAGRAVHLRVPAGEAVWPSEVSSTVYRVVQESLTNIARHAPAARSVTIDVAQDDQALTVEVTDDAPAAPSGYHRRGHGLIGMRERVEALGGTLQAGRRENTGWSIRARLPLTSSGPR
ncbi:ATP-binding protein [Actinomycetes bacterium KLBMP 9759]